MMGKSQAEGRGIGDRWKAYKQDGYAVDPHQTFCYLLITTTTPLALMSMHNVAAPDNDIGSRAVFVAPDNWGDHPLGQQKTHVQLD